MTTERPPFWHGFWGGFLICLLVVGSIAGALVVHAYIRREQAIAEAEAARDAAKREEAARAVRQLRQEIDDAHVLFTFPELLRMPKAGDPKRDE
jgi:hypothetical protein